jgi:hypothetical protein
MAPYVVLTNWKIPEDAPAVVPFYVPANSRTQIKVSDKLSSTAQNQNQVVKPTSASSQKTAINPSTASKCIIPPLPI